MIPLNEITGSSLDALFVYMALLGILLLAASWLRLKKILHTGIPDCRCHRLNPRTLFSGHNSEGNHECLVGNVEPPHCFDLCPDADGKKAEKR